MLHVPQMFILWQYLTEIIDTKSIPGKIYENFGMVHFAEINHVPSPYSILQDTGRVETTKKLSQILANNIDNGGRGTGLRIYVRYYSQRISVVSILCENVN